MTNYVDDLLELAALDDDDVQDAAQDLGDPGRQAELTELDERDWLELDASRDLEGMDW